MKMSKNTYLNEVESRLLQLSKKYNETHQEKLKKYIGTNLKVLGLNAKEQRLEQNQGFSFYNLDKESVFFIYDYIYKTSQIFEIKNAAFIYLDKNYKHVLANVLMKHLTEWVNHVDNWAHSDTLSKYLTRLLEHPETQAEMFETIQKWNSSINPWERRQSIIALYYYARTKNTFREFDIAIHLISNLLQDKDYYVQKAVGWTLRESFNVYPKQTFAFIETNIKDISSTAFTTSIEKMDMTQKTKLKNKRKKW